MATYLEQFPKIRKFTPVVVTWHDAITETGDVRSDDVLAKDTPIVRRSIGWWVGVGEFNVMIAMERDKPLSDDDTDCGGIGKIPKRMVTGIRRLSVI